MAGLGAESDPETPGNKKRKRKEKKRQWVWTIGTTEDESDGGDQTPVPRYGLPKPIDQTPMTAIWVQPDRPEEKPMSVSIQQSEQADQPASSELAEHSEELEQMDLQHDGVEHTMATPPPENLFSMQFPTIKIDFGSNSEWIDRPGTSHSI